MASTPSRICTICCSAWPTIRSRGGRSGGPRSLPVGAPRRRRTVPKVRPTFWEKSSIHPPKPWLALVGTRSPSVPGLRWHPGFTGRILSTRRACAAPATDSPTRLLMIRRAETILRLRSAAKHRRWIAGALGTPFEYSGRATRPLANAQGAGVALELGGTPEYSKSVRSARDGLANEPPDDRPSRNDPPPGGGPPRARDPLAAPA